MAAGTDFDRLADYVTSRRVDLGIDQAELADRMGMHRRTVSRIETGQSVKRDTYATLEKELGWTPGSARRVLEGGTPTVRSGAQSAAEQAVEQLSSLDGPELLEASRRWLMRLSRTEFEQALAAAERLRRATVLDTESRKAT
jgi:transcriptional regulator with XRE-family HTH domain